MLPFADGNKQQDQQQRRMLKRVEAHGTGEDQQRRDDNDCNASLGKRCRKQTHPHRHHEVGEEGKTGNADDDQEVDDPQTIDEMVTGAHCNVDDDDDDDEDDDDNDKSHKPFEVRGTRGEGRGRESTRKSGKTSLLKQVSPPPLNPLKVIISKPTKP